MDSLRVQIVIEGTPVAVRLVAHQSDPGLVMVKGVSEVAVAAFCEMARIERGPVFRGSNYWMAEAPRDHVVGGVGLVVDRALDFSGGPEALPSPNVN